MVETICGHCKCNFFVYPYRLKELKEGGVLFCSRECKGLFYRKPDEHKRIMANLRAKKWRDRHPEKMEENSKSPKKKEYYLKNRGKILAQRKNYWEKNRDTILQDRKKKYKTNEYRLEQREYRKNNPDKFKKYRIKQKPANNRIARQGYQRKKNNPQFKLNLYIGNAIRKTIRGIKGGESWQKILGYTVQELKTHLESKFTEKMSWGNYGSYWHIDHKIPKSHFKYTSKTDEAFKKCWGIDNLQPLEALANLKKGNKLNC